MSIPWAIIRGALTVLVTSSSLTASQVKLTLFHSTYFDNASPVEEPRHVI